MTIYRLKHTITKTNTRCYTHNIKSIIRILRIYYKPILLKKWSSTNEIGTCNILFIPNSERKNIDAVLSKMAGKPTLIITESLGYAKKGAGINFVIRDNKVNFEINKNSIAKAGLKIKEGLEKLAVRVF